jgi:hypothetical protein
MANRGTGGKSNPRTPTQRPPKGDEAFKDDRTQDVASPRAKNSGHGKKTADKWNQ